MAMALPDPFSSTSAPAMWSGGPPIGGLYQFPATQDASQPVKHTLRPMVTGTSVLGITFDGGVMLAADTLGSYGSLARFRSVSRLRKVTDSCVVAGTGDYADFQHIERIMERLTIKSDSLNDGHQYTPQNLFSLLTRILYNRRSRINPLWNTLIVGGYNEEKPFLGFVNSIGTAFDAPTLATGLGGYIAQPLLRAAYEQNPAMSKEEAKELLERSLRILFYRDCRALATYEIATVTSEGVTVEGPFTLESNWEVAHYVRGYD